MPAHIRKDQLVIVTSGSEKGKTGKVLRVIPKEDRVVVQGVAVRTKHLKPTRINPNGGVVRREASIHMSNVSPVVEGKPTRVRFDTKSDGSKVAVAVRNGKELWTVRSADAKKS